MHTGKSSLIALLIATASGLQTSANETRTQSEFTKNQIPVRVGECSSPRAYKDALERPRIAVTLEVFYCKEKQSYQERVDGTTGRGIFKRKNWVRVAGSEKLSYELGSDLQDFDLSASEGAFRDVQEYCEKERNHLVMRSLSEKKAVRCR